MSITSDDILEALQAAMTVPTDPWLAEPREVEGTVLECMCIMVTEDEGKRVWRFDDVKLSPREWLKRFEFFLRHSPTAKGVVVHPSRRESAIQQRATHEALRIFTSEWCGRNNFFPLAQPRIPDHLDWLR